MKEGNSTPPASTTPKPTAKRNLHGGLWFALLLAIAAIAIMRPTLPDVDGEAKSGKNKDKASEPAIDRRPRVVVAEVQPIGITDTIRLPGTIEPWIRVELAAETSGRIEKLSFREGQILLEADLKTPIAAIDEDYVRATLKSAEAEHALAASSFERVKKLHEEGVATAEELDRAMRDLDVAKGHVETAKVELARCTLFAPFPGIIDKLPVEEGDFVQRGQMVCDLVDMGRVKLVVPVPEMDIPFVKQNQTALADIEAIERDVTGRVIHVGMVASEQTRTFPVKIAVDNKDHAIRPGMIARVTLVRRRLPDAIAVPMFCVVPKESRVVVFVEEDGVASEREVKVGVMDGELIQIKEGLATGDKLVVQGHRSLRDGDEVKVVRLIRPEEYLEQLRRRSAAAMGFPGAMDGEF